MFGTYDTPDQRNLLDQTRVLNRGPYSIHFTAGPDVINFGDGNGINLTFGNFRVCNYLAD